MCARIETEPNYLHQLEAEGSEAYPWDTYAEHPGHEALSSD